MILLADEKTPYTAVLLGRVRQLLLDGAVAPGRLQLDHHEAGGLGSVSLARSFYTSGGRDGNVEFCKDESNHQSKLTFK